MEALHIGGGGRYLIVEYSPEVTLFRYSTRPAVHAAIATWKKTYTTGGAAILDRGNGGFAAYDLTTHVVVASIQVYDLVGPKAVTAEDDSTPTPTKKRRGKKAD